MEEVKADEEDDDQIECREARISTDRKTYVRKEGDTKKAGKTPTGFVNQKISRHASGLITSEGRRKGGRERTRSEDQEIVNCVAGACAFCTPD